MERTVWSIYYRRGSVPNYEFSVLADSVEEALAEFGRLVNDPDRVKVTHVAATNTKVNV